jgi:hypothetical protein
MKKWLIPALLLVVASVYVSSNIFGNLNDPFYCARCHASEYKTYISPPNNSDMPFHKEKGINCMECHSGTGIQSNMATKKLLIDLQLINYSLPLLNRLMSSNFTLNQSVNASDFAILEANCTKCHNTKKIISFKFNHSNTTSCDGCHLIHKEVSVKVETSFWRHIGEGGHRNLTCGNCHGTDPTRLDDLPQCTKCHKPHLKNAQWDRSICLGCHSDPHLPVRNAVFKDTATKEMCAACHHNIYDNLTMYDSKHNRNVPACINCHPKHKQALACGDCHIPHGPLHPGKSNCDSCHLYVNKCTDCHTNPHAPRNGLPSISDEGQLKEYAKQVGSGKTG